MIRRTNVDEFLSAVSEDLYDLSRLLSVEITEANLLSLRNLGFPTNLGLVLTSDRSLFTAQELRAGLMNIPVPVPAEVLDSLAVDFADIFLNNTFGASPAESVWLDDDNLMLQEPTFQVRDVYKRHNIRVRDWRMVSDDHAVSELEFVAYVLSDESDGAAIEKIRIASGFLDEHVLRWLPQFAEKVSRRAATRFYSGLVGLTASYLEELRGHFEQILGELRPTADEIEQRMRPEPLVQLGAPSRYVPGADPSW